MNALTATKGYRFLSLANVLCKRFIKLARFFFASLGLTYEQSAVKLVVRVPKSGTVLYKPHEHISLLNVTFVRSCLLIYSI